MNGRQWTTSANIGIDHRQLRFLLRHCHPRTRANAATCGDPPFVGPHKSAHNSGHGSTALEAAAPQISRTIYTTCIVTPK